MDENEFEFEGKTYVSVDAGNLVAKCSPCAFYKTHDCVRLSDNGEIPYCDYCRDDMRNVIFVEKQK